MINRHLKTLLIIGIINFIVLQVLSYLVPDQYGVTVLLITFVVINPLYFLASGIYYTAHYGFKVFPFLLLMGYYSITAVIFNGEGVLFYNLIYLCAIIVGCIIGSVIYNSRASLS